jgi:hypothetical protein
LSISCTPNICSKYFDIGSFPKKIPKRTTSVQTYCQSALIQYTLHFSFFCELFTEEEKISAGKPNNDSFTVAEPNNFVDHGQAEQIGLTVAEPNKKRFAMNKCEQLHSDHNIKKQTSK